MIIRLQAAVAMIIALAILITASAIIKHQTDVAFTGLVSLSFLKLVGYGVWSVAR